MEQVMQVAFRSFESNVGSWDSLFAKAASFATEVGPERLIGISHSEGHGNNGVVTVWYWKQVEQPSSQS
jgi:hypothetical protein